MAGTDNLIPAKKGEVRNPKGKPIGTRNRSTIMREWLEYGLHEDGVSNMDRIFQALVEKASAGDVQAIKEAFDSAFGKNPDVIAGDPNAPLNNALAVTFVSKNERD